TEEQAMRRRVRLTLVTVGIGAVLSGCASGRFRPVCQGQSCSAGIVFTAPPVPPPPEVSPPPSRTDGARSPAARPPPVPTGHRLSASVTHESFPLPADRPSLS